MAFLRFLQYCTKQVQFSSVQFSSNGVPRRPSLPDPSGTSDREGTARHNWQGWTSGAGMVWLPSGPRVERARPASDELFWRFGVLGQTRARQGGNGGWRRLAERAVVGATECVPYPAQAPYLTHACALDTQVVTSTFRGCCSSEREQQREAVCQADRRRRGWRHLAAAATAWAAAAARLGGSNWRGRTDDWRRTTRAGVELIDEREGVPIAASLSWLRQGPARSRWSSRRA